MKINNITDNPYNATNIDRLVPDVFVAHVAYADGKTCRVSLDDVLDVYARWISGRLTNSIREKKYIERNGRPSPTYCGQD